MYIFHSNENILSIYYYSIGETVGTFLLVSIYLFLCEEQTFNSKLVV